MALKDLIRKAAADSTKAAMDVMEVDFGSGERHRVGVLHPTMKQRQKFAEIANTGRKKDGMVDLGSVSASKRVSVIDCCVDPETREHLWSQADGSIFDEAPAGGWVDKLAQRVMSLGSGAAQDCECGMPLDPGWKHCPDCGAKVPTAAEVAEKNSNATRNGS